MNLIRRALAAAGALALAALMVPPPSAVAIEPAGPCNAKCEADYEADAIVCGKKANESQRRTCQDNAHARYKSCRENCQRKDNGDCLERCKELCDQILDKCTGDCKKDRNPRECRSRCMDAYAKCLKECDRKCKGK